MKKQENEKKAPGWESCTVVQRKRGKMLLLREKAGVLRLVKALKDSMECKYEAAYLAHYLRYVPEELQRDVEAFEKFVSECLEERDII